MGNCGRDSARSAGGGATTGRAARAATPDAAAACAGLSAGAARDAFVPESLEGRRLLSVSLQNGWTVISPESGDRVIHVSTSGSDSNPGTSSAPIKSISKGYSMLRSGTGDQLLLKRGDTFSSGVIYWNKSGDGTDNPLVFGAYGSGNRPVVKSGDHAGIYMGSTSVSDVAIMGIEFYSDGHDPRSSSFKDSAAPDGIVVTGRARNILLEDNEIRLYRNNVIFQDHFGPISNIKLRRNVITDSYSDNGQNSEGAFFEGVNGILLEENVFDHNGWYAGRAGATNFNHNVYVRASNTNFVARGNLFANAASHGLQARAGGVVENNLFYMNAIGMSFGLVNGSPVTPGGVTGRVVNNVIIGSKRIGGQDKSIGLEIGNIKSPGVLVDGNVLAHGESTSQNPAITLNFGSNNDNFSSAVGLNDVTLRNNVVYGWGRGFSIASAVQIGASGPKGLKNLTVQNNDFQNIYSFDVIVHGPSFNKSHEHWSGNRYHTRNTHNTARKPLKNGGRNLTVSQWQGLAESSGRVVKVNYPDPGRTVSASFISGARGMSKSNGSSAGQAAALAAYIKAGFKGGNVGVGNGVVIDEPDDDRPPPPAVTPSKPSVSIGDASVTEGDGGYRMMTFTVRLSHASTKSVNVKWETKGDTARPGSDYVGRSSSFTFAPGRTSQTISIQVRGDNTRESDERFALNLLSVLNANISDGSARGTIRNDD